MSKSNKCSQCNELTSQRCGRCHNIYYCSQNCQRLDYKNHKQICSRTSLPKETQPSNPVVTPDLTKEVKENYPSNSSTTKEAKKSQTSNSFEALMAEYYAALSPSEVAKKLLEEPKYKHRKDCLDLRLAGGGPVKGLFIRAVGSKFIPKSDRAFALFYGSLQAIDRDLDGKANEGDFLGLQALPVKDLLDSWQSKQNLEQYLDDPDMIYVSVCTVMPLSTMRADLKDITICHCVTVISRKACNIDC